MEGDGDGDGGERGGEGGEGSCDAIVSNSRTSLFGSGVGGGGGVSGIY